MQLSLKRNTNFDKVSFFVPEAVLDAKCTPKESQNGAKKPLKIDQKSDAFFNRKNTDFLWKLEPKGSPKGPQNRGIRRTIRAPAPGPPQGNQMEPKWTQNGPNMDPKWIQIGRESTRSEAKFAFDPN